MSHFLTEEQQLIRNSVSSAWIPTQTGDAADKQGGFPYELETRSEQGYIGAYVPETYGGQGYDFTTYFVIWKS